MSSQENNNNADISIVKENILKIANELLNICYSPNQSVTGRPANLPRHINSIDQLNSEIYVYFYENVCDTKLIDKKYPVSSVEDEIHNVQAIVDSLSMDVLHEDLSHLTGEAIIGAVSTSRLSTNLTSDDVANFTRIEPDLVSIEYLLDILRCIHEWISSRLESTVEQSNLLTQSHFSEHLIADDVTKKNSCSGNLNEM